MHLSIFKNWKEERKESKYLQQGFNDVFILGGWDSTFHL
jgi:hypothetical protein